MPELIRIADVRAMTWGRMGTPLPSSVVNAMVDALEAAHVFVESGELDPQESVKRDALRAALAKFDFTSGVR